MDAHPNAGKPVAPESLTDIAELVSRYYEGRPEVDNPDQKVSFGTSGHRGTSLNTSFNEAHILAITEAIYAESFNGEDHLRQIQEEARAIVQAALG